MSDPFSDYDPYFDSQPQEHQEYMRLVREYFDELAAIKALLGDGEADRAKALWDAGGIPYEARCVLWKAPTKGFGSIFETWERELLRSGSDCLEMPVSAALKRWVQENA